MCVCVDVEMQLWETQQKPQNLVLFSFSSLHTNTNGIKKKFKRRNIFFSSIVSSSMMKAQHSERSVCVYVWRL